MPTSSEIINKFHATSDSNVAAKGLFNSGIWKKQRITVLSNGDIINKSTLSDNPYTGHKGPYGKILKKQHQEIIRSFFNYHQAYINGHVSDCRAYILWRNPNNVDC